MPRLAASLLGLGLLAAPLAAQAQTAAPVARDTIRVSTPDNQARGKFNEGNGLLRENKFEEALVAFEAGLRLDARSVTNQYGKAVALAQLEREADAIAAFERVAELAEAANDTEYLARAQERLGQYALVSSVGAVQGESELTEAKAQVALPAFEQAAEAGQGNAMYHYQYARVLNALGRHDDAVTQAQAAAAAAAGGDASAYHYELGMAHVGAGRTAEARTAFEQARGGTWGAWADYQIGLLDSAAQSDGAADGTAAESTTTEADG